ncbi:MAG: phosphopantetheine-binding protein [Planctomycetota bacterium]|jgi:acyl carrier protein
MAVDTEAQLLELLTEVSGGREVVPGQRLAEDLGLDSLQVLELIARVDDAFGVDLGLRIADGRTMHTVDDVLAALEEEGGSSAGEFPAPKPARTTGEVSIQPLFFEAGGHRLYGALTRPGTPTGDRGVLLLPPMGHEGWIVQRAYRELGLRLAARGVPALRFDLLGTGDSEGDLWSARWNDWTESVAPAADTLRRQAGVSQVSAVGLRLGAALAVEAESVFDDLVLWDPVLHGAPFVRGLEALHAAHFADQNQRAPGELLGARFHPELLAGVAEVDARDCAPRDSTRLLWLVSSEQASRSQTPAWLAGRADDPMVDTGERWSWARFHSSLYWPTRALSVLEERFAPPA